MFSIFIYTHTSPALTVVGFTMTTPKRVASEHDWRLAMVVAEASAARENKTVEIANFIVE